MTEQQQTANGIDDSSRSSLGIMAAAAEHIAAGSGPAAPPNLHSPGAASSPSRRPKLVLPKLTPAMQQDLALTKSASSKSLKPLSIGARPEYADYALQNIQTPHPNDVLCGRGGGSNNHPGNESFRELVNEVKFPYVNCPKREKPLIARRIVEAVRNQTPPGRFLSKDSKTGLWNDIGDGKAREKTSQALREGAPIIREHMIGKPTSPPTNVAAVLKEAKKAERAEKEYGVRLPRKSPKGDAAKALALAPVTHVGRAQASPDMASPAGTTKKEPVLIQRGASASSAVGSPHGNPAMMGGGPPPPLKKFRSYPGEQDITVAGGPPPPAAWPPMQHQPPPSRGFGMMPPYGHHPGHMIGGYAPPPTHPAGPPAEYPGSAGDYAGGRVMPPRYPPAADSVPLETVRRLLLGQLDPVQLAVQILSPEEAAVVFHRHGRSVAGLQPPHPPHRPAGAAGGAAPHLAPPSAPISGPPPHPLKLNPVVSDGSSSTSSMGDSTTPSRQAGTTVRTVTDRADDVSSVDSAKRSDASEQRALPKKKRKYVEEPSMTQ